MDIFDSFATDAKLETEGAWFTLGKDTRLLVARAGNDNYLSVLRKKLEVSGIDLSSTTKEDEDAANEIFLAAMAQAILLGWEGVSFKGEKLSYSVDNALKLLRIKEFRKRVAAFSETFESFKAKAEAELGNA